MEEEFMRLCRLDHEIFYIIIRLLLIFTQTALMIIKSTVTIVEIELNEKKI